MHSVQVWDRRVFDEQVAGHVGFTAFEGTIRDRRRMRGARLRLNLSMTVTHKKSKLQYNECELASPIFVVLR